MCIPQANWSHMAGFPLRRRPYCAGSAAYTHTHTHLLASNCQQHALGAVVPSHRTMFNMLPGTSFPTPQLAQSGSPSHSVDRVKPHMPEQLELRTVLHAGAASEMPDADADAGAQRWKDTCLSHNHSLTGGTSCASCVKIITTCVQGSILC